MSEALVRGWTVVRVLQESVWKDKHDWESRVRKHLRRHTNPRCILLDSDDKCEYDPLREIMTLVNMPGTNE
jgi:hypothetical protein